jgi:hypothetical protein
VNADFQELATARQLLARNSDSEFYYVEDGIDGRTDGRKQSPRKVLLCFPKSASNIRNLALTVSPHSIPAVQQCGGARHKTWLYCCKVDNNTAGTTIRQAQQYGKHDNDQTAHPFKEPKDIFRQYHVMWLYFGSSRGYASYLSNLTDTKMGRSCRHACRCDASLRKAPPPPSMQRHKQLSVKSGLLLLPADTNVVATFRHRTSCPATLYVQASAGTVSQTDRQTYREPLTQSGYFENSASTAFRSYRKQTRMRRSKFSR